ncbi:MAG: glycosyltransferase family 9 protein [Proteobacteria bacterium]|nr:glycosyltransferase family 9 protein [Pseudomonadota bacterium]
MRILFVTSTRIGDAVLSTGLLAHLIERYPRARITLACGPDAAPLFDAVPNIEQRITMTKRKWGLHWFDLWRRCIRVWWGWGLVVDLRGSVVAYFLPARRRRVYWGETGNRHRLYALAKALRLREPPAPRVWTGPEHEAEAARLVPEDGPVLGLGPTANWPGKIWPGESFVELVERLTAPDGILAGARVAVFGAAGERPIAQPVLDAIPAERRIDLVGTVDLLTAAAVLRRCALYIGNDSGLMHIAAAAGAPTLGLFGPSRAEIYAPWGPNTAVVKTAVPYEMLFPPDYDHRTTGTLMDSLSVDAVEDAATELWRRCLGEPG